MLNFFSIVLWMPPDILGYPQNIFLFIGEWEEELINTHTRALAFNFSLVPPSYSASSLVKRAGLVWCSKDLPYLKVAEILPVLTLWFNQYVLMEGERGWGSYFSVHIILCISLILDQDEHFDDRQCVHFKWTWTGICDKNVSSLSQQVSANITCSSGSHDSIGQLLKCASQIWNKNSEKS